jgi:hypothetical protein
VVPAGALHRKRSPADRQPPGRKINPPLCRRPQKLALLRCSQRGQSLRHIIPYL